MKQKNAGHSIQGVFVFVLLGIFAVMSTLTVLMGAQMYRGTVDRGASDNEERVLTAYVRSMVRAGDSADSIRVEETQAGPAIVLTENYDGEEYVTWLYAYEGKLYEQFTEAAYEFDPEAGTAICPVASFEPSVEDGLLTVRMTDARDRESEVRVALRCHESAGQGAADE